MRDAALHRTAAPKCLTWFWSTRHRVLRLVASSLLVFALAPLAPARAETPVEFSDAHLESAVRAALSKPDGALTEDDMAALSSLDATSQGIADLTGLQFATHLTRLDLAGNQVTTLTPIAALRPASIDLSENWLDIAVGTPAKAVIDAWVADGVSVACEPQGHPTAWLAVQASSTVDFAEPTTLTATLAESSTVGAVASATVRLESSPDGVTFADTHVASTTASGGVVAFSIAPTVRTYYRVAFDGCASRLGASASPSVCVTPRVALVAASVPPSAWVRGVFSAAVTLMPRHAAGTSPVALRCFRHQKVSGAYTWVLKKTFATKAVDSAGGSRVSAKLSLPKGGTWLIAAYYPGDSLNAETFVALRTVAANDRRIESAIRWAKARSGSHSWDHYCLRFATDAYGRGAKTRIKRFETAKQAADALHAKTRRSTSAPRGAFVFYHSWHGSTDLGHVGISLGGGRMISDNGNQGVIVLPIKSSRYVGWAPPPISPRIDDWD
jgi:hypothetical protein